MADVTIDIELVTAAFNKALKQAEGNVKDFEVSVNKTEKGLTTSFKKIDKSAKNTAKGFTVLKGAASSFFGNLAATAVTSVTSALREFAQVTFDNVVQLEQLETQFEVLTGSAETAKKTLADLRQFSTTTPFQLKNLAEAGAQLIGFGVDASELIPRLQKIGDVASSVNKPIGDLALIFGQVQAAGKLTGERLLQLEERAIPIGDALAKALGKPRESIRELVSKGVVDFETFKRAFDSISDVGGQAFNGMAKQSQTLGGLISTLKDNFNALSTEVGLVFLPFIKSATIGLTNFIKGLRQTRTENFADQTRDVEKLTRQIEVLTKRLKASQVDGVSVVFNADKIKEDISIISERLKTISVEDAQKQILSLGEDLKVIRSENKDPLLQDVFQDEASIEAQAANIQSKIKNLKNFISLQNNTLVEEEEARIKAEANSAANLALQAERQKQEAIKSVRDEFAGQRDIAVIDAEIAVEAANENDLEILRELELVKTEILLESELERASKIQDVKLKAQAEETARQKAEIAQFAITEKSKVDIEKRSADIVKNLNTQRIATEKSNTTKSIALAKEGALAVVAIAGGSAKAAFIIGQVAATAGVLVDDGRARAAATLAAFSTGAGAGPGAPAAIATAKAAFDSAITASTALSLGIIGAQTVGKFAGGFQNGGVVGGTSFTGDNLTANVNSDEVILNSKQAANTLFQLANQSPSGANNGGLTAENVISIVETTVSNMNITLVADDNEIARSTSRGVADGVVIGVSA